MALVSCGTGELFVVVLSVRLFSSQTLDGKAVSVALTSSWWFCNQTRTKRDNFICSSWSFQLLQFIICDPVIQLLIICHCHKLNKLLFTFYKHLIVCPFLPRHAWIHHPLFSFRSEQRLSVLSVVLQRCLWLLFSLCFLNYFIYEFETVWWTDKRVLRDV